MSELHELVELIGTLNGLAASFEMDVTKRDSIVQAIDAAERQLGPIGILINNSGISVRKKAAGMTEADYDDVMATNTKGARKAYGDADGLLHVKSSAVAHDESVGC